MKIIEEINEAFLDEPPHLGARSLCEKHWPDIFAYIDTVERNISNNRLHHLCICDLSVELNEIRKRKRNEIK